MKTNRFADTPRIMIFRIIILFCVFCSTILAQTRDLDIQKELWSQNIDARHIESSDKVLEIEFTNRNPEKQPAPPGSIQTNYVIVGPTMNHPEVSLIDYTIDVFKTGNYIATINKNEPADITIPSVKQILTLKTPEMFRNFVLWNLEFCPSVITFDSEGKQLEFVFRRLHSRIIFNQALSDTRDAHAIDPFGSSLVRQLALNSTDAERFFQPDIDSVEEFAPYRTFVEKINSSIEQGHVVKIMVYNEGIHAITYDELKKAGVDTNTLILADLRLFFQNEEVPLYIVRGTSQYAFFSPGDVIYFYAPDPLSRKHDFDMYWLLQGTAVQSPPLRMQVFNETSDSVIDINTGSFDVREYHPREYHHMLSSPMVLTRWFWDAIPKGEFRKYETYLSGIDESAKSCEFTIHVGTIERNKFNTCNLYVNNILVDTLKWRGWRTNAYTKNPFPAEYLKEGLNTVSIELPENIDEGSESAELLLLGFSFTYNGALRTQEDRMVFSLDNSTTHSQVRLNITMPDNEGWLYLFNVTDPSRPYCIKSQRANTKEHVFYDARADFSRYYVINNRGAILPQVSPHSKRIPLFDSDNGADYLIVSHPRFLGDLKPFITARGQEQLRVFTADIFDVYDAFSFGCKESFAIQRLVKYAYYNWTAPRLGYMLIVGESSDLIGDPARYPDDVQRDLVPVYNHENPESFVRADSRYGTITGERIMDVAVGRFSVNSSEELAACIHKALRYQQSISHFGYWRHNILFTTDDEPEFPDVAEYLLKTGVPMNFIPLRLYQHEFDYTNFYRVIRRKKSPSATQQLIDFLNAGTVIYNFFGHGGPNIWTAERLFHVFEDLPLINNADKLSFLTSSSCDTAWLDYPTPPVSSSIGELLVKTPDKGCVALFAPTTGATPSEHKRLMKAFLDSVFRHDCRRFGDVVLAAKIFYALQQGAQSVLDQFVLIGDPYVAFNFDFPAFKDLQISSRYINAKTGDTIQLIGRLPSPGWGWAEVRLINKQKRDIIEINKFLRVNASILDAEIVIPPLEPGRYSLETYFYNAYKEREFLSSVDIESQEPDLDILFSYDTPTTFPLIGKEFKAVIEISNPTDLTLQNIKAIVKTIDQDKNLIEQTINIPARGKWASEIRLTNQTPEVVSLRASAAIAANPESEPYYSISRDLFVPIVSPDSNSMIAFNKDEVTVKPEPLMFETPPEIIIPIYDVSGTGANHFIIDLRDDKGHLIGRRVDVNIPAWAKSEFAILSEETLTPGEHLLLAVIYSGDLLPYTLQDVPRNAFARSFKVIVHDYPDLSVVPDSVTASSMHFYAGETVHIDAKIINSGTITVDSVEVKAYVNTPLVESNMISPIYSAPSQQVIDSLEPGEIRNVSFRWDRYGRAGTYPVHVVVNPEKKILEQNYTNNIASTAVTFISEGNMRLDPADVVFSKTIATKGDTIDVRFVVHNDGEILYDDVRISFQQSGRNKDPLPVGKPLTIENLPPKSSIEMSTSWLVAEGYNEFLIEVNPRETINEDTYDDNKITKKIDYVVPLFDLYEKTSSADTISLNDDLLLGTFDSIRIKPDFSLTVAELQNPAGIIVPITLEHIINKNVVRTDAGSEDTTRDARWFLWNEANGWLEASPYENPEPVSLSIPVPDSSTTFYDVAIWVQTNSDYKGHPASKFKMKIEKDTTYQIHDYSKQTKPWFTERYYLGRYNIYDGFFDMTFDNVEGAYWTIINKIEFVPRKGTYTSPTYDLTTGWKQYRNLEFLVSTNTPGSYTKVELFYRFSVDNSVDAWQGWAPCDLKKSPIVAPVSGRYMQWRAVLYSDDKITPTVSSAAIVLRK